MRKPLLPILLLAVGLSLAWSGCEETTGPGFGPVPEEPGEITLADFGTADVREPVAFDVVRTAGVHPAQDASWDLLFALGDGGAAELRPRGAETEGESSAAGLQTVDRAFDRLDSAPEGGYATRSPVAVEEGDVLAGRSRQDPNFAITCRHFFKLEVLSVDADARTITLRHLINPACERRNLVPGSSNRD